MSTCLKVSNGHIPGSRQTEGGSRAYVPDGFVFPTRESCFDLDCSGFFMSNKNNPSCGFVISNVWVGGSLQLDVTIED